jgi:hypothetical protein
MRSLFGVVVAAVPFAVVFALLAWASWRERRRLDVQARQIALTDSLHERLGAVAAPVVRRRRGAWQVCIAVSFERHAVIDALLPIVREAFAPRDRDRRSLEIVLTRRPSGLATKPPHGGTARKGVVAMDMNEYALEILARDRLAELRAASERTNLARAGGRGPRPLRAVLGHALIRLGHRLRGARDYSLGGIEASAAIDTRPSKRGAVRG